ncbi:MAG: oligosaccharide flippase family protein [Paludibacter sp.]|nr:oligosaccharide flippase family protein [Paludibacter sp.]
MKEFYKKIKNLLHNNKKVVENYFFMTVLQILNSFFYLLIYPYLIRVLGKESYGMYVFAYGISMYFVYLVGFGFDMPGTKAIALAPNNKKSMSHTLSCIFTAKLYLEIIAVILFVIIIFSIPSLRNQWLLYSFCFLNTLTSILFPQWYFQGIQKMRIVTLIQVAFKILSLPAIFLFVKTTTDVFCYALIISVFNISGAFVSYYIITKQHKIRIHLVKFNFIKQWYKDATPFFATVAAGTLKSQTIVILIGALFTKTDVAYYDLANKIVAIPNTLVTNINGALFPKAIISLTKEKLKKIIHSEIYIGLISIIALIIFGKWLVILFGGNEMLLSYPMVVILSFTILSWLVTGGYINFFFLPNRFYSYVTKNQFIALISFFVFFFIGIFLYKSVFILPISLSLSAITEWIYCWLIVKRKYNYNYNYNS